MATTARSAIQSDQPESAMKRARRSPSTALPSRRRSHAVETFVFKALRGALVALVLLAGAAIGWLAYFALAPLEIPVSAQQLEVEPGATFHGVARQLVSSGVLREERSFLILGRILGKSGALKAGIYQLPVAITPYALIQRIARGEVESAQITFIEGWTFAQLRAALDAHPAVRHDTTGLTDTEILRRLKAPEQHPEGLFFPDTYHFNSGASDLQILTRAYQTMATRLAAAWDRRAPELPYAGPYEALIMASIVEKETGHPDDRRMIAAVFVNRLKKGMRLQTDPTVIYGLGRSFDGNLRKLDLETDGPYNTYTRERASAHADRASRAGVTRCSGGSGTQRCALFRFSRRWPVAVFEEPGGA